MLHHRLALKSPSGLSGTCLLITSSPYILPSARKLSHHAYLECVSDEQHSEGPVVLRGAGPEAGFPIGQHRIAHQVFPGNLSADHQQTIHPPQGWQLQTHEHKVRPVPVAMHFHKSSVVLARYIALRNENLAACSVKALDCN